MIADATYAANVEGRPSVDESSPAMLATSLATTGYALFALAQPGPPIAPASLTAAAFNGEQTLPRLDLPVPVEVGADPEVTPEAFEASEATAAVLPVAAPARVTVLPLVAPPVIAPVSAAPAAVPADTDDSVATSSRSVFAELSLLDD